VSTDVMSDHIGRRDASHGGGCSKSSAYTGQFVQDSMVAYRSIAALRHREGGATLLTTGSNESCVICNVKLGVDEICVAGSIPHWTAVFCN